MTLAPAIGEALITTVFNYGGSWVWIQLLHRLHRQNHQPNERAITIFH